MCYYIRFLLFLKPKIGLRIWKMNIKKQNRTTSSYRTRDKLSSLLSMKNRPRTDDYFWKSQRGTSDWKRKFKNVQEIIEYFQWNMDETNTKSNTDLRLKRVYEKVIDNSTSILKRGNWTITPHNESTKGV